MRKVWIASILTIIMLLVPMTSVVGSGEVEDCNCNPVNNLQIGRLERLLNRLESSFNYILLKDGNIPEVEDKCKEILSIINSWRPFYLFCIVLYYILGPMLELLEILPRDGLLIYIVGLYSLFLLAFMFTFCFRFTNL